MNFHYRKALIWKRPSFLCALPAAEGEMALKLECWPLAWRRLWRCHSRLRVWLRWERGRPEEGGSSCLCLYPLSQNTQVWHSGFLRASEGSSESLGSCRPSVLPARPPVCLCLSPEKWLLRRLLRCVAKRTPGLCLARGLPLGAV